MNASILTGRIPGIPNGGSVRDGRDQRSSRCANGVPEGERTERRIGMSTVWWPFARQGMQIIQSGAPRMLALRGRDERRSAGLKRADADANSRTGRGGSAATKNA
jgi:hypothetical protein